LRYRNQIDRGRSEGYMAARQSHERCRGEYKCHRNGQTQVSRHCRHLRHGYSEYVRHATQQQVITILFGNYFSSIGRTRAYKFVVASSLCRSIQSATARTAPHCCCTTYQPEPHYL